MVTRGFVVEIYVYWGIAPNPSLRYRLTAIIIHARYFKLLQFYLYPAPSLCYRLTEIIILAGVSSYCSFTSALHGLRYRL